MSIVQLKAEYPELTKLIDKAWKTRSPKDHELIERYIWTKHEECVKNNPLSIVKFPTTYYCIIWPRRGF